jgi:predicted kinase
MKQKTLVVMVGIPGSGKSTYLDKLGSDAFVYSTDQIVDRLVASGTSFKDAFSPAKKEMNKRLREALDNGRNIVWDQTNLSVGKRKSILGRVPPEYRRECVCFVKPPDPIELNLLRQRVRARTVRYIPTEAMDRMIGDYVRPSIQEGFDKITFLDIHGKILEISEKTIDHTDEGMIVSIKTTNKKVA